tara:strand:- start:1858 stop:3231 length:1374 start_codon:yes stop_codon:yes gene_type:complete
MKKKNVYILSEYFKREFSSNILVSIIASSKNYNVYIGTDKTYKYLLNKNLLEPGIFHTKSVSHGKEKSNFHKNLYKKNFILTCMDEEHGVINEGNYDDLFIKPRMDHKDLKFFKAFFCWGKYDYKKLTKFFHKKKNFFHITGSPRVDLWKKNFHEIWKNEKLKKKNYTLIVSNFNFVNNHFSLKKIINKIKKEGYYNRSPKIEEIQKEYFRYQKKNIKYFLNMIKNLSKKLPNEKIIFRPHPTEKVEYWKKNLGKMTNVEIYDEGSISELINNANCVIQSGCTSAIEAFISNVPVVNYLPVKKKNQIIGKFISKFSVNIFSEKKLINIIKNKDFKLIKNKKKIVNQRMLFLDDKLSASKITHIWKKLFNKQSKFSSNNHFKIRLYLFFFDLITTSIRNSILFIKGKLYLKKKFLHKFPEINLEETRNKILKIQKVLNYKNSIKIKKIGKELINISQI